ncbi:MAG: carboxylating nicotinate-nucleotide diphosphorylase [Pigmentiphaga sp.]
MNQAAHPGGVDSTFCPALPRVMIEPLVRATLLEDLGRAGDLTSDAIVPAHLQGRTALVARKPGIVAGVDIARLAFELVDPRIRFDAKLQDGNALQPGAVIAVVEGPARGMLAAERTALNFMCHLSGIASATYDVVQAVAGTKAQIVCTRKTIPGMRTVQKYAVKVGGGHNHRFGLDDAVLIKDNHVAMAGGVQQAYERARAHVGHMVKIELEVDTLEQLDVALELGVDAILLDNMDIPTMTEAVKRVNGRAITEASGGITPETAPGIALTGVDLISIGWLTHSVKQLDIGLDHQA